MQNRNFKIEVLICFCFLASAAWAGMLDISRLGIGARSIALGRTQVAAQDLSAVFSNPACAPAVEKFKAVSMYCNIAEDVNFGILGLGFPLREGKLGTIGIAYLYSGVAGLQTTALNASGHAYPTSSFDYSSKLMIFSFGKEVDSNLSAGASLKFYTKAFEGIEGGAGSGVDIDLGFIFYPKDNLTLGLSAQNLLPADWGNMSWGTKLKEDIPANFKMGGSYTPEEGLLMLVDYDSLGFSHLGCEWWIKKFLALRCGIELLPNIMNYSLGVGLNQAGVSFDYAYYLDSTIFSNSSHFFSLGLELPFRTVELRPILPAQEPNSPVSLIDLGLAE